MCFYIHQVPQQWLKSQSQRSSGREWVKLFIGIKYWIKDKLKYHFETNTPPTQSEWSKNILFFYFSFCFLFNSLNIVWQMRRWNIRHQKTFQFPWWFNKYKCIHLFKTLNLDKTQKKLSQKCNNAKNKKEKDNFF